MLRTLLLASAACAFAGAAVAADLPSRRAPPIYIPPPIPVFTWTGVYAGVDAGYGWSNRSETTTPDAGVAAGSNFNVTVPGTHTLKQSGVTAGGQIGFNYQLGSIAGLGGGGIVVGIEADAAYTDLHRSDSFVEGFSVPNLYSSRLDYLGTVRGRVGYAFDRFLVYGTGGFAYGQTSYAHTVETNQTPPGVIWAGSRNGIQTGYAVGGGVEYALPTTSLFGSSAVTVGVEYLYYDLGTKSTTLTGVLAGSGSHFFDSYRTAGNIVRAKLNFKFGDPVATPVVARY